MNELCNSCWLMLSSIWNLIEVIFEKFRAGWRFLSYFYSIANYIRFENSLVCTCFHHRVHWASVVKQSYVCVHILPTNILYDKYILIILAFTVTHLRQVNNKGPMITCKRKKELWQLNVYVCEFVFEQIWLANLTWPCIWWLSGIRVRHGCYCDDAL